MWHVAAAFVVFYCLSLDTVELVSLKSDASTGNDPCSGLRNVAVVNIAVVQQVVGFQVYRIGAGIPRKLSVNDGVGTVGEYLSVGVCIVSHAVLKAIVQGQVQL